MSDNIESNISLHPLLRSLLHEFQCAFPKLYLAHQHSDMKLWLLYIFSCWFACARPSLGENIGERILSRNLARRIPLLSPEMGSFGPCATVRAPPFLLNTSAADFEIQGNRNLHA